MCRYGVAGLRGILDLEADLQRDLEVRHAVTLRPAMIDDRDLVILAAAYMGTTRLIDNLYLHLDEKTA